MRIGNVNNVRFTGPLEMEYFKQNPSLHNFGYLNTSEKLDMIYETLQKQNKMISTLSKNQEKMQHINNQYAIFLAPDAKMENRILDYANESKYKVDVIG